MSPDEAHEAAIEHVLWAAEQGLTPGDVLAAIGVSWPNATVSTETVVLALAITWRRMRELERLRDYGTYQLRIA